MVASALVPLFYGFDRARMWTCVFNYIWWFISLSCCIDIRYDLWSLKCINRSAPEFDIANYIGTETPRQVMQLNEFRDSVFVCVVHSPPELFQFFLYCTLETF